MANNVSQWRLFRIVVLAIWVFFALVLTTQTDHVPVVHLMASTIGSTDLGDALGHAGLFGMLAGVGYVTLATRLTPPRALLLAMIFALVVGTSTELFQIMVAGRSSSLSDMLANWLGVFVVGFVACYRQVVMSPKIVR